MSRRQLLPVLLILVPLWVPPSVPAEALQRPLAAERSTQPAASRKVVLHGVDIDASTGRIDPAALPVLDAAVEILSTGQGAIEIVAPRSELSGEPFDAALEQRRAGVVQQYLMQHGIAADRIMIRSPGASMQRACDAPAGCASESLRVELHDD